MGLVKNHVRCHSEERLARRRICKSLPDKRGRFFAPLRMTSLWVFHVPSDLAPPRRQESLPDGLDWLDDLAGKERPSHKLEYSREQRLRWSRMLSEIMALQYLTPSPPSPLPLGEGCRGEGKELMRQPQDSCQRSQIYVRSGLASGGCRTCDLTALVMLSCVRSRSHITAPPPLRPDATLEHERST